MSDLGTDIAAVDDLPDPEVLVDGEQNVAYAMTRRWFTPTDGQSDTGETEDYPSINVRDWLGGSFDFDDPSTLADLEQQATQVLLGTDLRVSSCTVQASYNAGKLTLAAQGFGPDGPFAFVITIDGLTTQLLFPGQT